MVLIDEDDILSGAAKASVTRLDFDPHEYHWSTLHIELVLLMSMAQKRWVCLASPGELHTTSSSRRNSIVCTS